MIKARIKTLQENKATNNADSNYTNYIDRQCKGKLLDPHVK